MSEKRLKGWKELNIGAVIDEPGNSEEYETGAWSPNKAFWHKDRCIHCLTCFIVCPDNAVEVRDGKVVGVDHYHCKGCGICAVHCPTDPKAIEVKPKG